MDVQEWLKRVEQVKSGADLSRDEDLAIAVMNVISLEEHFYFTAMKTGNGKYLEMLNEVREMRKKLLGKLVRNPQGEEWCISKHLLAGSMRLIEVGTKELGQGKDGREYFQHAFELFSLFFAINLRGMDEVKTGNRADDGVTDAGKNAEDGTAAAKTGGTEGGVLGTFSKIIKKIVDCCKE